MWKMAAVSEKMLTFASKFRNTDLIINLNTTIYEEVITFYYDALWARGRCFGARGDDCTR